VTDRDLVLATELIKVVPPLLWALLTAAVLVSLRRPFMQHIVPRLTGVHAFGIRLDLRSDEVQEKIAAAAAGRSLGDSLPETAGQAIVARAANAAAWLVSKRLLWVDDEPLGTASERELLHRMGVFVETARSNEEALSVLRRTASYDMIVSDIDRASGASGLDLLRVLPLERPPVIFYVGRLSGGVPIGAFGITNRPDELLHLVMDICERSVPRARAGDTPPT
jgi:hypothetical protein